MNHSENVDHDAVLRARTMLLGSDRPSLTQEVQAYRVLARVSPAAYLPKLVGALLSYGYDVGNQGGRELLLALHAEAADAARRIDAGEPNRTEVLCRTLDTYRHTLLRAGRRAEGFAVCEEMAEAGRLGFERGQVKSSAYGHGPLATMLAEEGRHAEAAEALGTGSRQAEVCFWSTVARAAELDAAGRHDEALAVFTELVDDTRRKTEAATSSLAILVWELVHRSRMFEASGRHEEEGADRREALALLARLAEAGEPKVWSNILSWWCTLYALSGRTAEPAGSREAPTPPFGTDFLQWSPDTRESYFADIPVLETEVAGLVEAGRLPEAVTTHRRLTRRSSLLQERRTYRIEEHLRPLFDQGVALARRLPTAPGTLAETLTDRAMFLVAAQRYEEAHADFAAAVELRGAATSNAIVTRT
ncbi:hypothetical protein [Streptomyces exfoliatus]|uniref:hypothetical protein n=1 Tax=Streptomyces exfoliatus TaxID=1905 RepID=UPI00068F7F5C|nr:hypothetical protein [Streptomyces exfoliatus]